MQHKLSNKSVHQYIKVIGTQFIRWRNQCTMATMFMQVFKSVQNRYHQPNKLFTLKVWPLKSEMASMHFPQWGNQDPLMGNISQKWPCIMAPPAIFLIEMYTESAHTMHLWQVPDLWVLFILFYVKKFSYRTALYCSVCFDIYYREIVIFDCFLPSEDLCCPIGFPHTDHLDCRGHTFKVNGLVVEMLHRFKTLHVSFGNTPSQCIVFFIWWTVFLGICVIVIERLTKYSQPWPISRENLVQ